MFFIYIWKPLVCRSLIFQMIKYINKLRVNSVFMLKRNVIHVVYILIHYINIIDSMHINCTSKLHHFKNSNILVQDKHALVKLFYSEESHSPSSFETRLYPGLTSGFVSLFFPSRLCRRNWNRLINCLTCTESSVWIWRQTCPRSERRATWAERSSKYANKLVQRKKTKKWLITHPHVCLCSSLLWLTKNKSSLNMLNLSYVHLKKYCLEAHEMLLTWKYFDIWLKCRGCFSVKLVSEFCTCVFVGALW